MPGQLTASARDRAPLAALGGVLAIAMLVSAWRGVPAVLLPVTLPLGVALIALVLYDAAQRRLPDALTLPLAVAGVATARWLGADILPHIMGALLGYIVCRIIDMMFRAARRPAAIGMGDAKLSAAAGAWLGWSAIPALLLLASLGALLWFGALALVRGRTALAHPMPFGVCLAGALWVLWLYGVPV